MQADITPGEITRLAASTKSDLKKEISEASKTLSDGEDDEIAVDGKNLDILIREIKNAGTKISANIGGNPALEASQLLALGANVYFAGNFFQKQKEAFPNEIFFKHADMRFARESKKNPVSLIFQHKSSRVILCDGSGRRMDGLRDYISSFPDIVSEMQKERSIDAISIPSWHVIFAGGAPKKDIELVTGTIEKIRKNGIMMFTETGSFNGMDDAEVLRIWQAYGAFDVVGMNEFECKRLAEANNIPEGAGTKNTLSGLLAKSGAHTVWLHTRDFTASASNKFDAKTLEDANNTAAAAGSLHVENGGYPDAKKISAMINDGKERSRNNSDNSANIGQKPEFSKGGGFRISKVKREVGAGDISAAAYLWNIVQSHDK